MYKCDAITPPPKLRWFKRLLILNWKPSYMASDMLDEAEEVYKAYNTAQAS